jgi:hypothetical protein
LKQFLNQEQINTVVDHYSQITKYEPNDRIKEPERYKIYYREIDNPFHWLLITQYTDIEFWVTFTDDKGIIIKRDIWNLDDNLPFFIKEEPISH